MKNYTIQVPTVRSTLKTLRLNREKTYEIAQKDEIEKLRKWA